MALERHGHEGGLTLPPRGRTFDVREEEGDRPGRYRPHREILPRRSGTEGTRSDLAWYQRRGAPSRGGIDRRLASVSSTSPRRDTQQQSRRYQVDRSTHLE